MDINGPTIDGKMEPRARFQSYKSLELPKNWQIVEENDDRIVFENREIHAQLSVTNTLSFRITDTQKSLQFERENITRAAFHNLLQNVSTGTW